MKLRWLMVMVVVAAVVAPGMVRAADDRKALRPVKLRSGPGTFHAILQRLDEGSKLSVVEDGKRWIKVRTGEGTEGWVSARVFAERPKPQGYEKLLEERGLSGVSSAVSTMATKGLTVQLGGPDAAVSPLVADFLDRVPFGPDEFERFSGDLSASPICEKLPGFMSELGQPLAGDPVRDERERNLGVRLAGLVLADAELITDPKLDGYVNQVGAAVAAASSRYDLEWRFVIFEQARPEAFAAPGGFVFLSDGLLSKLEDEAELAGVLAHQVAHVALAHGADALDARLRALGAPPVDPQQHLNRLVVQAHQLLRAARPAADELEADAYGATYAACAGYDPAGLARVYTRQGPFEPTDDHSPSKQARLDLLKKVQKAAGPTGGKALPTRFRKAVVAKAP